MRFDNAFLDEIRDRVPISTVIGQRVTWDRRKTNPRRGDYWAPCPFHGEKSPSFHCEDKKGRYHCFGCGASGDVFSFLTEYEGRKFTDAVEIVADLAGVALPERGPLTDEDRRRIADRQQANEKERARRLEEAERERQERTLSAGQVWKQTVPLVGTPGYDYFEWRCPGLAPAENETEIRFHPALDLKPDEPTGECHPCVVARVSGPTGKGIAIWRIYIRPDGKGKMATRPGFSAKLGFGPSAGGAVRLGGLTPPSTLGLCEGTETGRAIRCLGTTFPVWPALSTSGIMGFIIPEGVKRVVCFPDPDGDKWKTRARQDGTEYIAQPPGPVAVERFKEANPGRDIVMADAAWSADYLAVLQKLKGVPIR